MIDVRKKHMSLIDQASEKMFRIVINCHVDAQIHVDDS